MNKALFFIFIFFPLSLCTAQEHRYINTTTMGVLAGTSTTLHEAPLSFISEHQYRFHRIMAAGLMTGIEQLNENTIPAGLSFRIFMPSGGFRIFAGVYSGFNISLEKPPFADIRKSKGGYFAGTETGAMIRINGCASLIIGLGYRYSELNYDLENWWIGDFKRNITFNRFSVRVGIVI